MPVGKEAAVMLPVALGSKDKVVVAWSGFVSVGDVVGVGEKTKLVCVRKENCELMVAVGADGVGVSEVLSESVELALDGKMMGIDEDDADVVTGTELPLAEIPPDVLTDCELLLAEEDELPG